MHKRQPQLKSGGDDRKRMLQNPPACSTAYGRERAPRQHSSKIHSMLCHRYPSQARMTKNASKILPGTAPAQTPTVRSKLTNHRYFIIIRSNLLTAREKSLQTTIQTA